jgi:hypothetical protein
MKNIPHHPPTARQTRRVVFSALVLCLSLVGVSGAWASSALYLCPGNLFTNDIDPAQARAQGCKPAQTGRLSQGQDLTAPQAAESETAPDLGVALPGAAPASPAPPAAPAPAVAATPRSPVAPEWRVDAGKQRQRDSQAREILLTELTRTQSQIQALAVQPGSQAESALQRLRADEAALQRELSRRPG